MGHSGVVGADVVHAGGLLLRHGLVKELVCRFQRRESMAAASFSRRSSQHNA